jgi:hypothetical protein
MRNGILISTTVLIGLLPGGPSADVSLSLIEYRVLAPIGQVRLTTSFVHDPATQKSMLSRLAYYDRQGLILVAGDSVREIRRRERIGSHSIETTIHVYPATGRGYGGGLATADVVVKIDGKQRVDCPYVGLPVELADVDISPADGTISVFGSYDQKRIAGFVSLNQDQEIDLPWLQRHAK